MWLRLSTLAVIALFVLFSFVAVATAQTPSSNDTPALESSAESDANIDPPRLTWAPNSKYPKSARDVGHQGTSILNLVIGINGRPHDITIVRPLIVRPLDEELDALAIAPSANGDTSLPFEMASCWKFNSMQGSGFAFTTRSTAISPSCGIGQTETIREPIFSSQGLTTTATVCLKMTN